MEKPVKKSEVSGTHLISIEKEIEMLSGLGLYHAIYEADNPFWPKRYEPIENPSLRIKAEGKLCLQPSEVADVYLLSFVLPYKLRLSNETIDEADHSAIFTIYSHLKTLANKHLLSSITWLIAKKGSSDVFSNIQDLQRGIIEAVNQERTVSEILKNIPVNELLNRFEQEFRKYTPSQPEFIPGISNDETPYLGFVSSLKDLQTSIAKAEESQDPSLLIASLTILHSTVHHSGGAILEELLVPGKKEQAYDLLLRFASSVDNDRFGIESAKKFASSTARTIYYKLSRSIEPFSIPEAPKEYSDIEQGLYLGQTLIREVKDRFNSPKQGERTKGEFFIQAITALEDYPRFKEFYPLVRVYLQYHREQNSISEGSERMMTQALFTIFEDMIENRRKPLRSALAFRLKHRFSNDPPWLTSVLWGIIDNNFLDILFKSDPRLKKSLREAAEFKINDPTFGYLKSLLAELT